jgi:GT2 family glycosyltransferase
MKVVTNDTNRGFAVACNQAAAESNGEIVVFLNNDNLIKHWLEGMLAPFGQAAWVLPARARTSAPDSACRGRQVRTPERAAPVRARLAWRAPRPDQ